MRDRGERNTHGKFLISYSSRTLLPFVFFICLLLLFISTTNSCSRSFFSSSSSPLFLSFQLHYFIINIFMNPLCLILLLLSLHYSSFYDNPLLSILFSALASLFSSLPFSPAALHQGAWSGIIRKKNIQDSTRWKSRKQKNEVRKRYYNFFSCSRSLFLFFFLSVFFFTFLLLTFLFLNRTWSKSIYSGNQDLVPGLMKKLLSEQLSLNREGKYKS